MIVKCEVVTLFERVSRAARQSIHRVLSGRTFQNPREDWHTCLRSHFLADTQVLTVTVLPKDVAPLLHPSIRNLQKELEVDTLKLPRKVLYDHACEITHADV
jgi:hypothetical protein